MPIITLKPNVTLVNPYNTTLIPGGWDLDDVLRDAVSDSYAAVGFGSDNGYYGSGDVGFEDVSGLLPPGAIIKQIRGRAVMINVSAVSDGDGSFAVGSLWAGPFAGTFHGWAFWGQNQIIDIGNAVEVAGPWIPRMTNGQPWTAPYVNGAHMKVGLRSPNTANGTEVAHVYQVFIDVEYNERPTTTITAPAAGLFEVPAPLVSWDYSDPEGDAQDSFEVKIFNSATYSLGGFNPDAYSPSYSSGRVQDAAARSWQAPALPNGDWRIYVRTFQTPQSGQDLASAWSYVQISLVALPINRPMVITFPPPISTDDSVLVGVRGGMNLLSLLDSGFEGGTGLWFVTGPATFTSSGVGTDPANVMSGSFSGFVSSNGATAGQIISAYSGASQKIDPYEPYEAMVWVKPAVTLTISFQMLFQTAANANLGGSPVTIPGIVCPANQWTKLTLPPSFAPPGVDHARLGIVWAYTGPGGEFLWMDQASIKPSQIRNATLDPTNDSFFENSAGSWATMTNATVPVRTTVGPLAGTGSMQVQAIGAGTMRARLYNPGSGLGIPTFGGRDWTISMLAKGTAGRGVYIGYQAYDKDGRFIIQDDGAQLGTLGTPNSTWNRYTRTFTVPANAATIYPYIMATGMGAGESLYMDQFTVYEPPAGQLEWGRGGLWLTGYYQPDAVTYEVQVTYDNGATWEPLPHVTADPFPPSDLHVDYDQTWGVSDWAIPPQTPTRYRARTLADVTGGRLVSDWSESDPVTVPYVGARLKDPYNSTSVPIRMIDGFSRTQVERQSIDYPLGRDAALVASEGTQGHTFNFTLETQDSATRVALEAVLASGRPLLLTNTIGETWWIKIEDGMTADLVKAAPEAGSGYGIRDFYRFSVRAVETVPPEI